jgi:hypothetical protein
MDLDVWWKRENGANGPVASYYSEAAVRRKKKNKKGCFHSPFFSCSCPLL